MVLRFHATLKTIMDPPIPVFNPQGKLMPSSVIDLGTTVKYTRFHRRINGLVKVGKHEILDESPTSFYRIHIPFGFLKMPQRLKDYLYCTLLRLNLFNSKLLDVDKLVTMIVEEVLGEERFACGFYMTAKVTANCVVMVNEEVEKFMREWGLVDNDEDEAFGNGEELEQLVVEERKEQRDLLWN